MELQRWVTIRQMAEIPIADLYNFFVEAGGHPIGLEKFKEYYTVVEMNDYILVQGSDGNTKKVTTESCSRKMREFYDKQFGL